MSRKKKSGGAGFDMSRLVGLLKVVAVICFIGGIGVGFVFLERYVREHSLNSEPSDILELHFVPKWVNEPLKEKILAVAAGDGMDMKIDENAALSVQRNIERRFAWMKDVKVRVKHDRLVIEGEWRKPVAFVNLGPQKFYVDEELVVLDYVPIEDLPIVRVKNISARSVPPVGKVWQKDDLGAAVEILVKLDQMDRLVPAEKPLLSEIDNIDVSNFGGRENGRLSHIIMYAKDRTEIIWGAEIGAWQRHLEATDEEKLAKLYAYYKEYGTLLGGVKYINLRDPQYKIPQPVDKY